MLLRGYVPEYKKREFINCGIIISLLVALLGGLAKMWGLIGNPYVWDSTY